MSSEVACRAVALCEGWETSLNISMLTKRTTTEIIRDSSTPGRNDKKESLRTYRRLLNPVGVPGKFVTEDASKIDIVKNDHIGVVFFVIVVLPAFVPPAETDNCRPAI
jgi:hypothetical protein